MSVTEYQEPETQEQPPDPNTERRNQVRQRRIDRLERRWWARKAINLFLVWHLFALAIWLLPSDSALVQAYVGVVRPYMTMTAFSQSWSMFSPYPDKMDVYLEAEITYADPKSPKGSWIFPRMAPMGYTQRYKEERWRKLTEVATHGDNHVLWPSLARYAARVNNFDSQNPPVSVRLIQHSRTIPPPGEPIPDYQAVPLQVRGGAFVQPIHPEDLR